MKNGDRPLSKGSKRAQASAAFPTPHPRSFRTRGPENGAPRTAPGLRTQRCGADPWWRRSGAPCPPRPEAAEGRPVTAPRRRRAMRHCVRAPQRRRERPELCGGGAGRPAGSQTARIPSGCDTPRVRGKGSPSLQPTFFWGGGGGRSGRFPSQHPYETNGRSLKFFCPTPPNLPHSPGSLCFSGVAPVIA